MSDAARFGTVAIVGVGLIGGSVGKALRARGLARRVVGIGRGVAGLAEAVEVGAIDEGTTRVEEGLTGADVVVVGTPVTQVARIVLIAARSAGPSVLVTDAGSTKREIVEAVERDPESLGVFVGGHPIAGSEKAGARFADARLFEGRACVLTPTERTPADRVEKARAFWSALGCRVLTMDPEAHDRALALTSHLPHAVAAALAATAPAEILHLAGGAYRDGTRVAGSDAALWAGIFLANRAPLLDAIDRFSAELAGLREAIARDDSEAVRAWWESARQRRSAFEAGTSTSVEH